MSLVALILVAVSLFGAVALTVFALAPQFSAKVDYRRRLLGSSTSASAVAGGGTGPSLIRDHSLSPWARLVDAVERRGLSLKDSQGDALAEKLMLAGYPQPYAVRVFVLIKTVLTLTFPIPVFLLISATGDPNRLHLYFAMILAAAAGMYLPNVIVGRSAERRKREILDGFPDMLDLLLVCVEAGLGMDAAFTRVGSEITTSHPLLAELLATVSLELRAGRTRADTLKNFSRRTALPEAVAFVTLLNQSEKLGSSVGKALEIYAAEMREGRRMRAEEKAARLPVLLSVPIVFFLVPVVIGVVMLPAAIKIRDSFASHAPVAAAK